MPAGTARGDYADYLIRVLFAICMDHNQNHDVLYRSDRVPALLSSNRALNKREAKWVIEDESGRFEVDAMFAPVGFVLRLIPFESKHL